MKNGFECENSSHTLLSKIQTKVIGLMAIRYKWLNAVNFENNYQNPNLVIYDM